MDQPKQNAETEKNVEQQLDRSSEGIAYRKLVRDIEKQLGSRYIKERSRAHKIEWHSLVKSGMTIHEVLEVHSDYADWAFGELIRAFLEMEE